MVCDRKERHSESRGERWHTEFQGSESERWNISTYILWVFEVKQDEENRPPGLKLQEYYTGKLRLEASHMLLCFNRVFSERPRAIYCSFSHTIKGDQESCFHKDGLASNPFPLNSFQTRLFLILSIVLSGIVEYTKSSAGWNNPKVSFILILVFRSKDLIKVITGYNYIYIYEYIRNNYLTLLSEHVFDVFIQRYFKHKDTKYFWKYYYQPDYIWHIGCNCISNVTVEMSLCVAAKLVL